MREGFVFYKSWNDAIQMLPDDLQLESYKAIINYGLLGVEPEGNGIVSAIFTMAKPFIDKNEERAANGSKGGRPPKSAKGSKGSTADAGEANVETYGSDKKNHRLSAKKPTVTETGTATGTDTVPPVGPPPRSLMDDIEESDLSAPVKDKIAAFIQHRAEMGQPYTPTALQSLIHEAQKQEQTHGARAVIDAIDASIASGYKGIVWDRIGSRKPRAKPLSGPLNNDEIEEAARRIDAGGVAFSGWSGGLVV